MANTMQNIFIFSEAIALKYQNNQVEFLREASVISILRNYREENEEKER